MNDEEVKPTGSVECGYLTLPQLSMPLDLREMFGRDADTEMEIGAGRGEFMIRYAAAHPELNFIAVERKLVILRRAGVKLIRSGLPNARIINGDIVYLLRNYVQPETLRAVHIYFPDPWPKSKQAKRRVFSPQNLELILRIIRRGGFLHVRTDVESYFNSMAKMADAHAELERVDPPEDVIAHMTNFEMRFVRDGKPIYKASWKKQSQKVTNNHKEHKEHIIKTRPHPLKG